MPSEDFSEITITSYSRFNQLDFRELELETIGVISDPPYGSLAKSFAELQLQNLKELTSVISVAASSFEPKCALERIASEDPFTDS